MTRSQILELLRKHGPNGSVSTTFQTWSQLYAYLHKVKRMSYHAIAEACYTGWAGASPTARARLVEAAILDFKGEVPRV